jgi:hypothetical protein
MKFKFTHAYVFWLWAVEDHVIDAFCYFAHFTLFKKQKIFCSFPLQNYQRMPPKRKPKQIDLSAFIGLSSSSRIPTLIDFSNSGQDVPIDDDMDTTTPTYDKTRESSTDVFILGRFNQDSTDPEEKNRATGYFMRPFMTGAVVLCRKVNEQSTMMHNSFGFDE